MVIFLRVSRGLGLDPESLKVPSNQLNLESLCFTGHGVAFGARALLRARVSKVSVEVPNQPSVTVRNSAEYTRLFKIPTAVEAPRRENSNVKSNEK